MEKHEHKEIADIVRKIYEIEMWRVQVMAAIDDLSAAVARVSADIKTAVTDLTTAIANGDDAAVEAQVALLNQAAASLEAALPAPPATPAT